MALHGSQLTVVTPAAIAAACCLLLARLARWDTPGQARPALTGVSGSAEWSTTWRSPARLRAGLGQLSCDSPRQAGARVSISCVAHLKQACVVEGSSAKAAISSAS